MKVGILTFHHTTNFGATLQAYALLTVLKSHGYDVELVDYRPFGAIKFYMREVLPVNISSKPHVNRHALTNLLKAWKMRRFLLSKMQLSKEKCYRRASLKHFHQYYDALICGSDQVWNNSFIRGFDPSYFLDFACQQTTRKISYAASFGDMETLGINRLEVCKLISQFDTILVRDSNSLQLVSGECGRQATKVLDPTFLIEYGDITSIPRFEDKYLLIHIQGTLTLEQERFIELVAKNKNLTVVSIGRYNKIADKNLIAVSPEEWLGYFRKASYIATNTYHGSIFSIIFQRLFTVFFTKHKSNKTVDLLNHLGLENRILKDGIKPGPVEEVFYIDYASAYKVLEAEILKSKTCLLEALDGKGFSGN